MRPDKVVISLEFLATLLENSNLCSRSGAEIADLGPRDLFVNWKTKSEFFSLWPSTQKDALIKCDCDFLDESKTIRWNYGPYELLLENGSDRYKLVPARNKVESVRISEFVSSRKLPESEIAEFGKSISKRPYVQGIEEGTGVLLGNQAFIVPGKHSNLAYVYTVSPDWMTEHHSTFRRVIQNAFTVIYDVGVITVALVLDFTILLPVNLVGLIMIFYSHK